VPEQVIVCRWFCLLVASGVSCLVACLNARLAKVPNKRSRDSWCVMMVTGCFSGCFQVWRKTPTSVGRDIVDLPHAMLEWSKAKWCVLASEKRAQECVLSSATKVHQLRYRGRPSFDNLYNNHPTSPPALRTKCDQSQGFWFEEAKEEAAGELNGWRLRQEVSNAVVLLQQRCAATRGDGGFPWSDGDGFTSYMCCVESLWCQRVPSSTALAWWVALRWPHCPPDVLAAERVV